MSGDDQGLADGWFEDPDSDEYIGVRASALAQDRELASDSDDLAGIANRELGQRIAHRAWLFWCILTLVFAGFIALTLFIVLLGLEVLVLPTAAAVAAISALGIQPFVLIGILTSNVFRAAKDS